MPKIAQDIEDKLRSKDVLIDDNLSFNSLFISEKILNALQQSGFRKPSPIQLKAIPLGKCGFGKDLFSVYYILLYCLSFLMI